MREVCEGERSGEGKLWLPGVKVEAGDASVRGGREKGVGQVFEEGAFPNTLAATDDDVWNCGAGRERGKMY